MHSKSPSLAYTDRPFSDSVWSVITIYPCSPTPRPPALYATLPLKPSHCCHQSDPMLKIQQNNTWAWYSKLDSSGPNFTSCYSSHPRNPSLQTWAPHEDTPATWPPFCCLEKYHYALQFNPNGPPRTVAFQVLLSPSSPCLAPLIFPLPPWSVVPGGRVRLFFLEPKCLHCTQHLGRPQ